MSEFTNKLSEDIKFAANIEHYMNEREENKWTACLGLSVFMNEWCFNEEQSAITNDLISRCKQCPFDTAAGHCLCKIFLNEHAGKMADKLFAMSR